MGLLSRLFSKNSQSHKVEAQPMPQPKSYTMRPQRIRLHALKFEPNYKQIVYVEGRYNEEVNAYIRVNYSQICAHFKYKGYEFCYLPYRSADMHSRAIKYYAPYLNDLEPRVVTSDSLFESIPIDERTSIAPSLLYYSDDFEDDDTKGGHLFGLMPIDLSQVDTRDFSTILAEISSDISRYIRRYSLGDNHAMYDSFMATNPDQETLDLIDEIESRVEKLAQKGISKHILQQIVAKPAVVSRMVVTRDYRIMLTDYDNMEIEMTPLVRAVYILFLRHPEGIVFKHLIDYRTELQKIYEDIKGEALDDKKMQSIIDTTDPTKNSINEKCARIREAFVTRFDERLAVNYIIQGERGEAKRIPLHREFVDWQ